MVIEFDAFEVPKTWVTVNWSAASEDAETGTPEHTVGAIRLGPTTPLYSQVKAATVGSQSTITSSRMGTVAVAMEIAPVVATTVSPVNAVRAVLEPELKRMLVVEVEVVPVVMVPRRKRRQDWLRVFWGSRLEQEVWTTRTEPEAAAGTALSAVGLEKAGTYRMVPGSVDLLAATDAVTNRRIKGLNNRLICISKTPL
jgi:hypothetical protein